ncbi:hypothetical protein [Yoonia sp.]|uniref:hypothetical protein n=1 Tax=Yoonia sp. TaxID=2212373 RepID=UPI002FD9C09D
MPLDPAQRHQTKQDAITAAWEAERLAVCDAAIALLREIADLDCDDDGDVIIGTDGASGAVGSDLGLHPVGARGAICGACLSSFDDAWRSLGRFRCVFPSLAWSCAR